MSGEDVFRILAGGNARVGDMAAMLSVEREDVLVALSGLRVAGLAEKATRPKGRGPVDRVWRLSAKGVALAARAGLRRCSSGLTTYYKREHALAVRDRCRADHRQANNGRHWVVGCGGHWHVRSAAHTPSGDAHPAMRGRSL